MRKGNSSRLRRGRVHCLSVQTGLSVPRFLGRAGREDTSIFLSLISRDLRPGPCPLRERGRNRKKTEWAQLWVAPHCPPLRAPVGHANAESQPYDAAGGCYKVPMDTDTSAIAGRDGRFQNGQADACTRARSRPIRPVGRGHRGAGHAAAIWLHAAHWHASPSLHRFGELRKLSVPAERHRLTVWDVWDMSGLPPAGPVPPARVENNDILCVLPTNETRPNDNGLTTSVTSRGGTYPGTRTVPRLSYLRRTGWRIR